MSNKNNNDKQPLSRRNSPPKRSLISGNNTKTVTTNPIKKESLFQPISPLTFPQLSEAGRPLCTIANIEHMLLKYEIKVSYNVIKKDVIISIPNLKSSKDNFPNVAEAELANLATLNGIYSSNFERFITAIASRNQVNPIMQWITSKRWDEKCRIGDFCQTLVLRDDYDAGFANTLITKWLLSAVAAAASPDEFSSRGVLTLQGPQGIGKTRWIASLIDQPRLASDCILLDHHLDANNKDSLIIACKHWIVEIGELDSSFRKDIARLKGFITNKEDKIRIPYAKRESVFQRRTVFAATVNDEEFLVDHTGNTRWWVLPCLDIEHNHNIDMQQLWAQVYETMFKGVSSPQWWLTDDEQAQLENLNTTHKKRTAIEDLLEDALEFDAEESQYVRRSASDVLKTAGIQNPTNSQAKECANFLRQRFGHPTRSQGKMRWKVPPIRGENNFPLPDGSPDKAEEDDLY